MFAVIKTGGKQYKVAKDDVIIIEKMEGETGDVLAFDSVLMVGEGAETKAGSPFVEGVCVAGEVVEQSRGDKVLVFKKQRRQNYRRTRGHRQDLTVVRITDILSDGKKPEAKKAAPKKAEASKTEGGEAEPKKAAKRAPAKKTPAKKAAAKKASGSSAAKKAPAKKAAAKKTGGSSGAKKKED